MTPPGWVLSDAVIGSEESQNAKGSRRRPFAGGSDDHLAILYGRSEVERGSGEQLCDADMGGQSVFRPGLLLGLSLPPRGIKKIIADAALLRRRC